MASPPPSIDISSLRADPDGPEADACIGAIDEACTDIGFFVAVGHGLDEPMAEVFAAARSFFAAPQTDKEAVPRRNRYGYIPHSSHALDRARASDSTEYLDMGRHDDIPRPRIPGFEAAVGTYHDEALVVAAAILRGLAIALDLDPGFFARHMHDPQCRLRFIHYLPTPLAPDGSRPVPNTPHTDYGLITLLATDGVPGLEVRPRHGEWAPVESTAGDLVVNLGDMLARWTNHRYVSTPHRVVSSPDRDRVSIPLFVNPDPSTEIACIPSCVTAESPCRYQPVTAGEFLASRIDGRSEPYVDPSEGPARMPTS